MKGRHARSHPAVLVVLALVLALGLIAGLASALAASPRHSPSSTGKVVLRLGWLEDPDSLNPFIGTSSAAYTIWDMNYDPLVGLAPSDLTPSKQIGLASDWTSTADGKTWTFTMRPNAKWQDGRPLTASDVAFTINWIVDHHNAYWVGYVRGVSKATALDTTHVRIACRKPSPGMLVNLAEIPILPKHIWAKIGYTAATTSFRNKPPIIGSGPFQCTQRSKSNYLVMEANKNYWRGTAHVDQIIFEMYTNALSMAQDMEAGAIDGCDGLSPAQVTMLSHVAGITAKAVSANGYDELGFNCYTGGTSLGNPVLRDWKFRQALQWAIDKNKLCAIAYGGMAAPADTVVTANYFQSPDWHWTPPVGQAYTFDPTKAAQMLTAAGYPLKNGVRVNKSGKPITLRLMARSQYPPSVTCGKLIAGWFRNLGLKIVFSTVGDGALESALYNTVNGKFTPNYDMFEWGWYNDLDPTPGLSYLTTSQINAWSDSAWSDPAYDKLFKQQSTEMGQAKRLQMVYQMQQIIYQKTPYIPLAYASDHEAWNTSRWSDWAQSPAAVGNVVFPPYGYETYFSVRPKTGAGGGVAGK